MAVHPPILPAAALHAKRERATGFAGGVSRRGFLAALLAVPAAAAAPSAVAAAPRALSTSRIARMVPPGTIAICQPDEALIRLWKPASVGSSQALLRLARAVMKGAATAAADGPSASREAPERVEPTPAGRRGMPR